MTLHCNAPYRICRYMVVCPFLVCRYKQPSEGKSEGGGK